MTIFMAGHETTGNGMAWTLYAVSEHPEVRERLERRSTRSSTDGRRRWRTSRS
jgi:cytochrome P450